MSRILLFTALALAAPARADERASLLSDLGAAQWHVAGWTGRGVKVAVLDCGFRGYRAHLGAELPHTVTARSFRSDGDLEDRDSNHGVLCAEVVSAVAPETELLIANWQPDRPDTFLRAIRWARDQGAAVITCSVVVPGWGDGRDGGPVNAGLRQILGDGTARTDPVMVAAAGNLAMRHWAGPFHGRDGVHEWAPGAADNRITPWSNGTVSIDLCPPKGSTYQIRLMDSGGRPVRHVSYLTTGIGGVSARFTPDPGTGYRFRIEHASGEPGPFRVTVLGADMEYRTRSNSIAFPAENKRVLAVGAVDADLRRLPCSGCGPAGEKPDLVGRVPFPSAWRREPFGGTSAAAPQLAGLAALVRCRHPDWPAARVEDYLRRAARDLGEPGPDAETGHGLIRLPRP